MDYTLSDLESAFYAAREQDKPKGWENWKEWNIYLHKDFKAYMTSLEALRRKIASKVVSNYQKKEKVSYKSANAVKSKPSSWNGGLYGC